MKQDIEFLTAALLGYEQQLRTINGKIQSIRQRLRGKYARQAPAETLEIADAEQPVERPAKRRNRITPAGRKRIAEAQRKRWKNQRAQAA